MADKQKPRGKPAVERTLEELLASTKALKDHAEKAAAEFAAIAAEIEETRAEIEERRIKKRE